MVGEVNDVYMERIQRKADFLGEKFNVESYTQKLFAEELLRSSLFFSLSMCLKKLETPLRQKANLGDWLVISQGRSYGSRGTLLKIGHLKDVQHETYD